MRLPGEHTAQMALAERLCLRQAHTAPTPAPGLPSSSLTTPGPLLTECQENGDPQSAEHPAWGEQPKTYKARGPQEQVPTLSVPRLPGSRHPQATMLPVPTGSRAQEPPRSLSPGAQGPPVLKGVVSRDDRDSLPGAPEIPNLGAELSDSRAHRLLHFYFLDSHSF